MVKFKQGDIARLGALKPGDCFAVRHSAPPWEFIKFVKAGEVYYKLSTRPFKKDLIVCTLAGRFSLSTWDPDQIVTVVAVSVGPWWEEENTPLAKWMREKKGK